MTFRQIVFSIFALATVGCDRPASTETTQSSKEEFVGAPSQGERQDRMKQVANASGVQGMAADMAQSNGPPVATNPSIQTDPQTPSMMIRTGDATVEVEKLDPAIAKVRSLAAKVGGYITNTSTSGGRDQIRAAMLELRIPAQRYDETVAGLADIGRVEATQTNAQDVGEEFVDVTARVDNARKLETRLIQLLSDRTGRLQDVLAVERELARIRTEIDQLEGRLRYLKNRVALSTLTVNLHEPQPIIGNSPGENPITAAIRQAWRNFVGFFASLIAALGVLIPLAVFGLIAWLVYRRFRARGGGKIG